MASAVIVAMTTALYAGADSPQGRAQAFKAGDTAASSFSGTKLQVEGVKPGIDPVTKTVIDPDGISLRIFDITSLGGPMTGQVMPQPPVVQFTAKDIGHVFGLAFDTRAADATPAPGLYAAATSAFGLNIVGPDKDGDGKPDRLKNGAPGATFMEGQFGGLPDASPGSIWKIDRTTGAVSLFANLKSGGLANSGPGIGGLAFDPTSLTLYASDLDTGLIHRLSIVQNGVDLGQFDHGVTGRPVRNKPAFKDDGERIDITSPAFTPANPATWKLTPIERRISGLAVRDGRLYYAVAEGPEIWSVGLETDGGFKSDVRFETGVKSEKPFPVMGIAFDRDGRLILSQRGDNQNDFDYSAFVTPGPSQVLRYAAEIPDDPKTPALWTTEPDEYATGEAKDNRGSAGGTSIYYSFKADGTADLALCGGTIVVSADSFGPELKARGLQLSDIGAVRPANIPPKQSVFVDLNPQLSDPVFKGYAGGVAAFQDCSGAGDFPPVTDGGEGGTTFPAVTDTGGGGFPPLTGGEPFPPVTDDVTDPDPTGGRGGKTAPLIVAKTASVATCSPKGGCAFAVTVSNPNPELIPGPIVIDERIEAPQATMTGEPNAPWTCTKAAPFTCTHPGPVPANGALDMRVVFAPNTPAEIKTLKNCAIVQGAELPADAAANAQTPAAPPPAAATVPAPTGTNVNGLQVEMKPVSRTCSPSTGNCEFEVKVTNSGAVPITGALTIDQTLSSGTQTSANSEIQVPSLPPGFFPCASRGPAIKVCGHADLTLAPGESRTVKLTMKVDPTTGGASTFVGNAAKVKFGKVEGAATAAIPFDVPVGPDGKPAPVADAGGAVPAATQQCATIALNPNAPVQSGPVIVAKKGAGKCMAKGPCTFTITLQNTLDFDTGEFVINEAIDAPQATLVGEPNAPWTCTKTAPFTCRHPSLPAKSTTELRLSFAPNTPPEKKELKNCAVPTSFTGGKAVPVQPNQIAPGKKTDLFNFRRYRPLIEPASFRPQSIASNSGLLHLTGGAGGNIGGVQPNRCLSSRAPAAFSVQQADGTAITFENVNVDAGGNITGSARIFTNRRGTFSGRFNGSLLSLLLVWSDGTRGDYTGRMDAEGNLTGLTRDIAGGPSVKFTGLQAWPCARDQFCSDYATKATNLAKRFTDLKCGPGVERWSTDANHHLTWCMGQDKKSPFLSSEPAARDAELAACDERVQQLTNRCNTFIGDLMNNKVADIEEFKKRQCPGGPPVVTDINSQKSGCFQSANADQFIEAAKKSAKDALGACIAQQAANGGAAGGGGGGAGGGGPAAEPAPEQCAVVPIDSEKPDGGGGGGKVEPAPVPQASLAGTLALTKTAGVCKANRSCDFTITVANTANAPFNGPVDFADEATGDGAFFGSAALTALQPWTCPKNGQSFACTATLTLAADEKKDFQFTADLGAGAGAVKEMKNCATLKGAPAPSCATAPLAQVQPPPPPPPADPNGLVLTKRRAADKCSDLGGGCAFIVRITNSSQAEFNGPIEFTDIIKTADGQVLPNATLEAQPLLTLAEGAVAAMSCTKAGDTVTCGTGGANAKIPPGKFVDAQLTMKPGPAGGAIAVRNCALLKSGGGQSCSSMSLVNGPLLRLTKFGGGDTCLPRCTFAVVIQNVGNADAKGAFKFKDTFTPASSLGGFDTLPQGGECSRGGDELFCVPNVKVLKPGELTTVTVTVFGKAKAPEYKNCVEFVPQPQAPKDSLVLDNTNQGRCVTVKDTSPQTPNLVIRKQAPNRKDGSSDGHCNLKSGCRFTITVTNTGLAPFTGPLRVTDTVSLGVPQFIGIGPGSPQSLPWKCDSVQNGVGAPIAQSSIKCELPPLPNGLAPGTTATLEVQVIPGATWKGSDRLKNCAEITSGGDIGANAQKQDCAEAILDPFNVKVAKTGDQSCPPGSNCTFKITLFNPGPIPHNAPVTITDALSPRVSAQIVSINPPLPCATQPSSIPFSCTSPGPVRLDLDAPAGSEFGPREFTMVVKMPSDGSAETYRNCISVAAGATDLGQEACHSVLTKPKILTVSKTATSASCDETTPCNFKITVTNTGAEPVAGPIEIADLARVGRTPLTQVKLVSASAPWTCIASAAPGIECSHPGPLPPNGSLDLTLSLQPLPGSLAGASEVRNCAGLAGFTSEPGACATIPVLNAPVTRPPVDEGCSRGMVLANGICACPEGTKWNGRICDGSGGINTTPGPTPPVITPPPVVTAPPASCTAGMILTAAGLCACPPAMKFSNGKCVGQGGINKIDPTVDEDSKPRPQSPSCPDGFVGTPPKCCPRGTQFRDGACRGPQETPPVRTCPQGFVGTPPKCCPRGTQFRDGACRGPQATTPVEKTRPKVCPSNRPVGAFPNCCPVKTTFKNGRCVSTATAPPQVRCPEGTILVNGQCRRVAIPTPTTPTPPQKCPPSAPEGTPPNCRCPAGTVSREGFCRPATCPPNMTGVPPNCNRICPAGTVNRNQECVPVPQPGPVGPSPKPVPQEPQRTPCPPGWDGDFQPNCAKPPS